MSFSALRQESLWDLARGCVITRNMLTDTLAIAKDLLLTGEQACTCFGWVSACRKWSNTHGNGCWLCPSYQIQSETLFQTRQDQERGMNGQASLLHSWHWVLLYKLLIQLKLATPGAMLPLAMFALCLLSSTCPLFFYCPCAWTRVNESLSPAQTLWQPWYLRQKVNPNLL